MIHVKKFQDFNPLNESYENLEHYMFFCNLEAIKRKCEEILSKDFKAIDELLKEPAIAFFSHST